MKVLQRQSGRRFPQTLTCLLLTSAVYILDAAAANERIGPWNVGSVFVEHACAQSVQNGSSAIAVYLTVHNLSSKDDHILAVTSQAAKSTAIHIANRVEGEIRRELLPGGLQLKYHQQIAMGPLAEHVLLEGLSRAADSAASIPITLVMLEAGTLDFEVPLNNCRDNLPNSEHAGHPS